MEIILAIIGVVVFASILYLAYWLKNNQNGSGNDSKLLMEYIEALRKDLRDGANENRRETQEKLDKINDRMARGLEHSTETLQKQFAESSKMIKDITAELSAVKSTSKQVLNFSEKLQSLENILKNPKKRGILGEYFLESLLSEAFQPNQYKMQYKFKNGEIVDAAIFFNDKIIPIDAKFSLEKYNLIMEENEKEKRETLEKEFKMDIKRRIDETSKYIRPNENTTDFAFMFIPAEGVYYNLLIYKVGATEVNSSDLLKYAFDKKVIIVSPTSFFAYLQTVLHGLKALKMEESIRGIQGNVEQLGRHLRAYEDYLRRLGGNIGTTVNTYNSAYKEFNKIDKDVYKITDGSSGGKVETILIDKPEVDA